MTRSKSRTLRGRAALEAFVDYLALRSGNSGAADALVGVGRRNGYANHQAILTFMGEIAKNRARYVYPNYGERMSIGQARFRPDHDEDEGTIGFGNRQITLDGIRIRMSASGVLVMSDRWADSVEFSTVAGAEFNDERAYGPDEWDLPGPVPPLVIDDAQVAAFSPRIALIVSQLLAIAPTDRAKAEREIYDYFDTHFDEYEDDRARPTIQWYASPKAALAAFIASGLEPLIFKRYLQDRPLLGFDLDVEVRLAGQKDNLRLALKNSLWLALGANLSSSIFDAMFKQAKAREFEHFGLARNIQLLAWYEFLEFNGVVLPENVRRFADFTRSVWLVFPANVIFAVERPTSVERTETGLTLVFADGYRLTSQTWEAPPSN